MTLKTINSNHSTAKRRSPCAGLTVAIHCTDFGPESRWFFGGSPIVLKRVYLKLLGDGEMPAHRSALQFPKHNILTSTYTPYPLLARQDFRRLILDYLVFVSGYLKKRMSVIGLLCKLETSPAKYTRWERMNEIFIHKAVTENATGHYFPKSPVFGRQ